MKIQKNYVLVKKTKKRKIKLESKLNDEVPSSLTKNITEKIKSTSNGSVEFIATSRQHFNSFSSITLSWDSINVYAKTKDKCYCCKKPPASDTNSNSDFNLEIVPSSNPTNSEVSNSTASISSSKKGYPNQILHNVCGIVYPGQCLAIMGASGSGKTTLLNALNSRTSRNFYVSGNVKINGEKVTPDELGSHIGFVPQDDLFIGTLTVFEHLKFLAMLKMSNAHTRDDKIKRVKEVIDEFKLTKCKDYLIGYTDKKGISGGEKRRLAFASEILTDPEILFCDEPTSGLDSHMAQMVVNTIFKLAKKGKTIISTIHQPSSQVFDKFDMLCLLAEGRVAYFGQRKQAYDFFSSMNCFCPSMFNPADYYIEILASKANHIESTQKIQGICDSFEKSEFQKSVLKQIFSENETNETNNNNNSSKERNGNMQRRKRKHFQSSYFTQFVYLFWRQFKSTLREPFSTRILFVQSIVIGIFLGFTYFQTKNDQASVQNKNGLLFIMLMQACLSYLFGVANQYHNQWCVTRFEVKNNVYSVFIYYVAKTLSEVPQNILFPTITTTIIFWTTNLHPSIIVYLIITSIVVLTANTAVGYGTFLAIIAPNLDSTVGLIGPTLLPLLIFSGFLINNKSMPIWFIWIKYISWIYYANEAMMITLWTNTDELICDKPDIEIPLGNFTAVKSQCLKTGQEVLDFLSVDKADFNRDIGLLSLMACFWPIVAGISLYIKSKLQ